MNTELIRIKPCNPCSKLLRVNSMYEGFNSVNCDHRNIVSISAQQTLIRLDIDLFQNNLITAPRAQNLRLRLIAKMTARARINDYMNFRHRYFLPAPCEIRYKYRRRPYYILF